MKYLLLSLLYIFPAFVMADSSCAYPSKNDEGSFNFYPDCGSVTGDKLNLKQSHLDNLAFDSEGLACVMFSSDEVFYILQNGRIQRTYFFDNGCDYFREDLARGIVGNNMVYINKRLDVVLSPGYEFVFSFDYGHAVVCNGPFIVGMDREHSFRRGGQCGLINKQGELVVDAKYHIEDYQVFQDYINSHNHCPKPPVASESAALCHAQRHISNMDYYSANWISHQISQLGDVWIISFVEAGSDQQESTLTLNASDAAWNSIVKESHSSVLQELQSEH